ncbi:hypothetical protein PV682_43135 [Streptomyces niveiscabiei]|uniref:hypothetical protein n=1 Tax=Streptomyces niveiscabiei TaxID=164115 RepID=UPI0029B4B6EE|nr:hypothetical protein [Streptomyces niveiscabiei]MDX3388187.1 hypothetical protein [Streptomyces niveiscabiei]
MKKILVTAGIALGAAATMVAVQGSAQASEAAPTTTVVPQATPGSQEQPQAIVSAARAAVQAARVVARDSSVANELAQSVRSAGLSLFGSAGMDASTTNNVSVDSIFDQ